MTSDPRIAQLSAPPSLPAKSEFFLSLRNTQDTALAREQFDSRLMALSKAHDILTQESWEGAPLRQIIDETVAPHSAMPLWWRDPRTIHLDPMHPQFTRAIGRSSAFFVA